jgi:hypothetical protein
MYILSKSYFVVFAGFSLCVCVQSFTKWAYLPHASLNKWVVVVDNMIYGARRVGIKQTVCMKYVNNQL